MHMKKTVSTEFFSNSKKWPRRLPKIKSITYKTLNLTKKYFKKNHYFFLNLIFTEKNRMTKLNKKFKNKYNDTDVLTFVSRLPNKKLGNYLYCDIFFSIDTIEKFIYKNNINLYEHFNHLLIHSILHINGYDHKNLVSFNKMKIEEIKILKKMGIKNPYIIND